MNDLKQYNKGDVVEETGKYVCVPCGYNREFKTGEVFGECTSCLAGTDEGQTEYVSGTAIWEKENSISAVNTDDNSREK